MSSAIRIEDLFYIYDSSGEKFVALRGLHLTINEGECLVVRGPNGSGKSTLVKLLTGYLTPTAGAIFIGERDIADFDPIQLRRELVASVDQRGNLIEELSILENLALGHQLRETGYKESLILSQRTLEQYGLAAIAESFPSEISAGQRQIASLLTALATEPKILIADEPSAELADDLARSVYTLLKELAGSTTVILVTHDPRAEGFADRIVRIQDGRISEEWSPGAPKQSVTDPFGWQRVQDQPEPILVRSSGLAALTMEPILMGNDLAMEFSGRRLFAGLHIMAGTGSIVAIDSNSSVGSGKSTLLKILAGAIDPSEGAVRVAGTELAYCDRGQRAELRDSQIGYLDQRSSALENISLADLFGELPIARDQSFLLRSKQPLKSFSGGERAYIELLKVLTEAKPLLLLDEPTSQMDEGRSLAAIKGIFEYAQSGGTVIIVTKEVLILESADRVINLPGPHN